MTISEMRPRVAPTPGARSGAVRPIPPLGIPSALSAVAAKRKVPPVTKKKAGGKQPNEEDDDEARERLEKEKETQQIADEKAAEALERIRKAEAFEEDLPRVNVPLHEGSNIQNVLLRNFGPLLQSKSVLPSSLQDANTPSSQTSSGEKAASAEDGTATVSSESTQQTQQEQQGYQPQQQGLFGLPSSLSGLGRGGRLPDLGSSKKRGADKPGASTLAASASPPSSSLPIPAIPVPTLLGGSGAGGSGSISSNTGAISPLPSSASTATSSTATAQEQQDALLIAQLSQQQGVIMPSSSPIIAQQIARAAAARQLLSLENLPPNIVVALKSLDDKLARRKAIAKDEEEKLIRHAAELVDARAAITRSMYVETGIHVGRDVPLEPQHAPGTSTATARIPPRIGVSSRGGTGVDTVTPLAAHTPSASTSTSMSSSHRVPSPRHHRRVVSQIAPPAFPTPHMPPGVSPYTFSSSSSPPDGVPSTPSSDALAALHQNSDLPRNTTIDLGEIIDKVQADRARLSAPISHPSTSAQHYSLHQGGRTTSREKAQLNRGVLVSPSHVSEPSLAATLRSSLTQSLLQQAGNEPTRRDQQREYDHRRAESLIAANEARGRLTKVRMSTPLLALHKAVLKRAQDKLMYLRNPRLDPTRSTYAELSLVNPGAPYTTLSQTRLRQRFALSPLVTAPDVSKQVRCAALLATRPAWTSTVGGDAWPLIPALEASNLNSLQPFNKDKMQGDKVSLYADANAFFKVTPPVIEFRTFEIGEEAALRVVLLNASAVSRRIRVLPFLSPYFRSVRPDAMPRPDGTFPSKTHDLIAPGVSVEVLVYYRPPSHAVMSETFVVETDAGPLHIPVHAVRTPPALHGLPKTWSLPPSVPQRLVRSMVQLSNSGASARFYISDVDADPDLSATREVDEDPLADMAADGEDESTDEYGTDAAGGRLDRMASTSSSSSKTGGGGDETEQLISKRRRRALAAVLRSRHHVKGVFSLAHWERHTARLQQGKAMFVRGRVAGPDHDDEEFKTSGSSRLTFTPESQEQMSPLYSDSFAVFPQVFELPHGGTQILRADAWPQTTGSFQGHFALVCDNGDFAIFSISCDVQEPCIRLTKIDSAQLNLDLSPSSASQAVSSPSSSVEDASSTAAASTVSLLRPLGTIAGGLPGATPASALSLAFPEVEANVGVEKKEFFVYNPTDLHLPFEVLLSDASTSTIVANPGHEGCDEGEVASSSYPPPPQRADYAVFPSSGVLPPNTSCQFVVSFAPRMARASAVNMVLSLTGLPAPTALRGGIEGLLGGAGKGKPGTADSVENGGLANGAVDNGEDENYLDDGAEWIDVDTVDALAAQNAQTANVMLNAKSYAERSRVAVAQWKDIDTVWKEDGAALAAAAGAANGEGAESGVAAPKDGSRENETSSGDGQGYVDQARTEEEREWEAWQLEVAKASLVGAGPGILVEASPMPTTSVPVLHITLTGRGISLEPEITPPTIVYGADVVVGAPIVRKFKVFNPSGHPITLVPTPAVPLEGTVPPSAFNIARLTGVPRPVVEALPKPSVLHSTNPMWGEAITVTLEPPVLYVTPGETLDVAVTLTAHCPVRFDPSMFTIPLFPADMIESVTLLPLFPLTPANAGMVDVLDENGNPQRIPHPSLILRPKPGAIAPIHLSLAAVVSPPRVHVPVPTIDFGPVNVGLPDVAVSAFFTVQNPTAAPVHFALYAPPGVGGNPFAITSQQYPSHASPALSNGSGALSFEPATGVLQPGTSTQITVTFRPRTPQDLSAHIHVYTAGVTSPVYVHATAHVRLPQVQLSLPIVDLDVEGQHVEIGVVRVFHAKLHNLTSLPTPFTITRCPADDDAVGEIADQNDGITFNEKEFNAYNDDDNGDYDDGGGGCDAAIDAAGTSSRRGRRGRGRVGVTVSPMQGTLGPEESLDVFIRVEGLRPGRVGALYALDVRGLRLPSGLCVKGFVRPVLVSFHQVTPQLLASLASAKLSMAAGRVGLARTNSASSFSTSSSSSMAPAPIDLQPVLHATSSSHFPMSPPHKSHSPRRRSSAVEAVAASFTDHRGLASLRSTTGPGSNALSSSSSTSLLDDGSLSPNVYPAPKPLRPMRSLAEELLSMDHRLLDNILPPPASSLLFRSGATARATRVSTTPTLDLGDNCQVLRRSYVDVIVRSHSDRPTVLSFKFADHGAFMLQHEVQATVASSTFRSGDRPIAAKCTVSTSSHISSSNGSQVPPPRLPALGHKGTRPFAKPRQLYNQGAHGVSASSSSATSAPVSGSPSDAQLSILSSKHEVQRFRSQAGMNWLVAEAGKVASRSQLASTSGALLWTRVLALAESPNGGEGSTALSPSQVSEVSSPPMLASPLDLRGVVTYIPSPAESAAAAAAAATTTGGGGVGVAAAGSTLSSVSTAGLVGVGAGAGVGGNGVGGNGTGMCASPTTDAAACLASMADATPSAQPPILLPGRSMALVRVYGIGDVSGLYRDSFLVSAVGRNRPYALPVRLGVVGLPIKWGHNNLGVLTAPPAGLVDTLLHLSPQSLAHFQGVVVPRPLSRAPSSAGVLPIPGAAEYPATPSIVSSGLAGGSLALFIRQALAGAGGSSIGRYVSDNDDDLMSASRNRGYGTSSAMTLKTAEPPTSVSSSSGLIGLDDSTGFLPAFVHGESFPLRLRTYPGIPVIPYAPSNTDVAETSSSSAQRPSSTSSSSSLEAPVVRLTDPDDATALFDRRAEYLEREPPWGPCFPLLPWSLSEAKPRGQGRKLLSRSGLVGSSAAMFPGVGASELNGSGSGRLLSAVDISDSDEDDDNEAAEDPATLTALKGRRRSGQLKVHSSSYSALNAAMNEDVGPERRVLRIENEGSQEVRLVFTAIDLSMCDPLRLVDLTISIDGVALDDLLKALPKVDLDDESVSNANNAASSSSTSSTSSASPAATADASQSAGKKVRRAWYPPSFIRYCPPLPITHYIRMDPAPATGTEIVAPLAPASGLAGKPLRNSGQFPQVVGAGASVGAGAMGGMPQSATLSGLMGKPPARSLGTGSGALAMGALGAGAGIGAGVAAFGGAGAGGLGASLTVPSMARGTASSKASAAAAAAAAAAATAALNAAPPPSLIINPDGTLKPSTFVVDYVNPYKSLATPLSPGGDGLKGRLVWVDASDMPVVEEPENKNADASNEQVPQNNPTHDGNDAADEVDAYDDDIVSADDVAVDLQLSLFDSLANAPLIPNDVLSLSPREIVIPGCCSASITLSASAYATRLRGGVVEALLQSTVYVPAGIQQRQEQQQQQVQVQVQTLALQQRGSKFMANIPPATLPPLPSMFSSSPPTSSSSSTSKSGTTRWVEPTNFGGHPLRLFVRLQSVAPQELVHVGVEADGEGQRHIHFNAWSPMTLAAVSTTTPAVASVSKNVLTVPPVLAQQASNWLDETRAVSFPVFNASSALPMQLFVAFSKVNPLFSFAITLPSTSSSSARKLTMACFQNGSRSIVLGPRTGCFITMRFNPPSPNDEVMWPLDPSVLYDTALEIAYAPLSSAPTSLYKALMIRAKNRRVSEFASQGGPDYGLATNGLSTVSVIHVHAALRRYKLGLTPLAHTFPPVSVLHAASRAADIGRLTGVSSGLSSARNPSSSNIRRASVTKTIASPANRGSSSNLSKSSSSARLLSTSSSSNALTQISAATATAAISTDLFDEIASLNPAQVLTFKLETPAPSVNLGLPELPVNELSAPTSTSTSTSTSSSFNVTAHTDATVPRVHWRFVHITDPQRTFVAIAAGESGPRNVGAENVMAPSTLRNLSNFEFNQDKEYVDDPSVFRFAKAEGSVVPSSNGGASQTLQIKVSFVPAAPVQFRSRFALVAWSGSMPLHTSHAGTASNSSIPSLAAQDFAQVLRVGGRDGATVQTKYGAVQAIVTLEGNGTIEEGAVPMI